ncbi:MULTISPECIES: RHS repeat-associated core domain-containing protein [unclassified Pseudomonas]|uniref:RHS repeat-associated core domain-containing protein n=1 Tax=unclassified Pseudomonas TaxID=196821 RepID=UPI000A1E7792|nr:MULTISPECIES: RHS repeat-associated core domain-containing protein [unclassified Pseudomonas]
MNTHLHWHTPTLQVHDPRALGIRQVEYLRTLAGEDVRALITHQHYDVAGLPVAQRDPRLTTPNTTSIFALNGQALKNFSVDSGTNVTLPGLAGETLQSWDANGNHRLTAYDNQLRPLSVAENNRPDVETFTYANATADPGHNLRGQMIERRDPSGSVEFHSIGLTGNGLYETRTFHDAKAFVSRRIFSPLGAVLATLDAGGHRQQMTCDVAGQLTLVQLQLNGQSGWQPVLKAAQYNAAGQTLEQQAGNGVTSHWQYHAADGLLHRHSVQKASDSALQDFEYKYDRVGNITHILDHTYTPSFFRNQQVDGHRTFDYDSLYRLIHATGYTDAPPSDHLGRPQPTDPDDRRNYSESYQYDDANNLVKTIHMRDGASHTFEMFIDINSNRGVRWKQGDPPPDFTKLFDPAGNLQALQPGVPMNWNNRSELDKVTLVDRNGSSANDDEYYRYSQGERVYKRHDTHTTNVNHFHEVRYLQGLEIRTRDNGEELHLITLPLPSGNVVCLHWKAGKPTGITADQLRYTFSDHLGSVALELDQQAQMISQEGYLPFGTTAWMVARTLIEVDYRFIRYSGKEMDVTRLYYYGARYYANWLGRWVSADRAGTVDGLNLYAYVSNNPVSYVDPSGGAKAESVIMLYSGFLSTLEGIAGQTMVQIDNVIHQKNIKRNLLANTIGEVASGVFGYEAGNIGGEQISQFIPDVEHYVSNSKVNRLPFVEAVTGGNVGGDVAGGVAAPITGMGLVGALIPQTSKISVSAIDQALGIPEVVNDIHGDWQSIKDELIHPALNSVLNPEFVMGRLVGAWISILGGAFNLFARAVEAEDIKNRLDPVKIGKIETMLSEWKEAVEQRSAWAEAGLDALGTDVIYPADHIPNITHMTSRETLAPITRSGLRQQTAKTLDYINRMQAGMAWYKEMGTTDNQFLTRQRAARR